VTPAKELIQQKLSRGYFDMTKLPEKNKMSYSRPGLDEQDLRVIIDGLGLVLDGLRNNHMTGNYYRGVYRLRKKLAKDLKRVTGISDGCLWEKKVVYSHGGK
jgi:hypothetical protein